MVSGGIKSVQNFEEFCIRLLESEGFEVYAVQVSSGDEYSFMATSREDTHDGSISTEWLVECTTRIISADDISRLFSLGLRYSRPVLLITSEGLTSIARDHMYNINSSLVYKTVVWDGDTLGRKVHQKPWLASQLRLFRPPLQVQPDVDFGEHLIKKLAQCKPGKDHWRRYEELMVEILSFLFVPALGRARTQVRTLDGLEIRDALLPNKADEGFWLRMYQNWGAHFVLFEFKNLKDGVGAAEVDQVRIYTQRKSIGRLAFVCGRFPPRDSAVDAARAAYQYSDLMVVLLHDALIQEMIRLKGSGQPPHLIVDDLIDEALISY